MRGKKIKKWIVCSVMLALLSFPGNAFARGKHKKALSFSVPDGAISAEELNGNAFIVNPEKITVVKMSATDINRLVCSHAGSEIKVIYPKRKGINVKIVGNNAFVEFVVKKAGSRFVYQTAPVEMYVMCDDTVYSLIAFPQRIPSVTIYLKNKAEKLKAELEVIRDLPYEKRIVQLVKAFFSGNPPAEASYVKVDHEYNVFSGLEVKETGRYVFEGEGIVARIFTVKLKDRAEQKYVDLREKDFLRKEITLSPIAIAIDRLRLYKGEKTLVVIFEKKPAMHEINFLYQEGG